MKKDIRSGLIGMMVMVHPQLTTDPYNKRGETGMITGTNGERSGEYVIQVTFQGQAHGVYQADALLTLYPTTIIRQGLTTNYKEFTPDDRSILLQVLSLIKKGNRDDALQLAVGNDTARFYCTINVQVWLEMKQRTGQKKDKGLRP